MSDSHQKTSMKNVMPESSGWVVRTLLDSCGFAIKSQSGQDNMNGWGNNSIVSFS